MGEKIFHNALVLPVTGEKDWFHGWIAVGEAGTITGIGEGSPPAGAASYRDVGGAFLAPGFVSAHSHINAGGMRGVAPSSPLYEWVSLNGVMLTGSTADDTYWFALQGGLDHLSAGITSVYNFTQSRVALVFDYATSTQKGQRVHGPEFVTRQVDGLIDAGIRFISSVRLDDEQLGEDDALAGFDAVMDYIDTVDNPLNLGGSIFGGVQWASSPATAERERAAMDRYGITNQAHFVETFEQLDIQRAKFDWYQESGCLRPGFVFGHFVHPTAEMVTAVRDSGTSIVWQPMSNGRLGSGVCAVPDYLRQNITVGIGVDDQSCTDLTDPFENMRTGMFTQRAVHRDASILTPQHMLALHTLGSAAAVGIDDKVGSLEVGKFADFVIVDPNAPDLGPIWDPVATYVLACGLRNLREVYVGGRPVWMHGVAQPRRAEADAQAYERMVAAAAQAGIQPVVPIGVPAVIG